MRAIAVLIPLVLLVILAATSLAYEIQLTQFARFLLEVAALLAGLIAVVAACAVARRNSRRVVYTTLIISAIVLHWTCVRPFATQVSFWFHRSSFEDRLARTLAMPNLSSVRSPSPGVRVDPGPPVRVAFQIGFGLADNWTAVVYDPTGLVLRANRNPQGSQYAGPEMAAGSLFGGWIVRCEELAPGWYRCIFT